MKILILFIFVFLSFYEGAFAIDIVSSPTLEEKGFPIWYTIESVFDYAQPWSASTTFYHYKFNLNFNSQFLLTFWTTIIAGSYYPWLPDFSSFYNSCKILKLSDFVDIFNCNSSYFIINKNNNSFFNIISPPFINGNQIVLKNGSNLDFYNLDTNTMTLGTPIQTIPIPSPYFGVMAGTIPIHYNLSTGWAFVYQGTDWVSYKVLDSFAYWSDLPVDSVSGNVRPLGSFLWDDAIFARQTAWSGSLYIWNLSTATPQIELNPDYILSSFNTFQNPIAYFTTSENTIVKWDMNCITPWYDSCRLNGGVFKCTDNSGILSPWGELCGGIVSPPSEPTPPWTSTCSDWIKNQDETGIDFWGVCNCYQKSYMSTTFVPFNYVNWFLQYSPFSVPYFNETLNFVNSGTTWIEQDFKYSIHVNQASYSWSLLDVMTNMNITPSWSAVQYKGSTEIEVELFADQWTDWKTTDLSTLWSNAINRVHVLSNRNWELKYKAINNISTNSGIIENVEDTFWTTEYPYIDWDVEIKTIDYMANRYTRKFIIRFMDSAYSVTPYTTITSIQWGSINKVISSSTVCPVKPDIVSVALENIKNQQETQKEEQEKILSWNSGEWGIFSCNETWLGVLICPFQIVWRIWEKFLNALSSIWNFLYWISSIASPSWVGNILWFDLIETANAWGMNLETIWKTDTWATSADFVTQWILSSWWNAQLQEGGIYSIFTYAQYFFIVLTLFVILFIIAIAIV